jgi:hypothetical protein
VFLHCPTEVLFQRFPVGKVDGGPNLPTKMTETLDLSQQLPLILLSWAFGPGIEETPHNLPHYRGIVSVGGVAGVQEQFPN